MKWEEESKAMIGTFLHNFTNPAIEQLVRTGKEKIYRCAEDDINTHHSLSECDFEIPKRHQAPAHIWGLPR